MFHNPCLVWQGGTVSPRTLAPALSRPSPKVAVPGAALIRETCLVPWSVNSPPRGLVCGLVGLDMAWPRLQLLVGLGLVASKKYKYPGDDKGLECLSFRSEHREQLTLAENNHQFADDGELALWRTGQQFFARPKRNAKLVAGKYLDVGCGTGRVIMILGGLFESVTCVEADPARIDLARSNWYSGPWGKTSEMSFHNVRFGLEYISNASSYDAISCFHVVQHIPESILRTWLSKMYSMLKRSGVLVLATKHRRVDVLELSDGTRASPEKFNAMAFHSEGRRPAGRALLFAGFAAPAAGGGGLRRVASNLLHLRAHRRHNGPGHADHCRGQAFA